MFSRPYCTLDEAYRQQRTGRRMKRSGCVALAACRSDFKRVGYCSLCRDIFMKLLVFNKD